MTGETGHGRKGGMTAPSRAGRAFGGPTKAPPPRVAKPAALNLTPQEKARAIAERRRTHPDRTDDEILREVRFNQRGVDFDEPLPSPALPGTEIRRSGDAVEAQAPQDQGKTTGVKLADGKVETCVLVKPDPKGDPYEKLLAGLPDLVPQKCLPCNEALDRRDKALLEKALPPARTKALRGQQPESAHDLLSELLQAFGGPDRAGLTERKFRLAIPPASRNPRRRQARWPLELAQAAPILRELVDRVRRLRGASSGPQILTPPKEYRQEFDRVRRLRGASSGPQILSPEKYSAEWQDIRDTWNAKLSAASWTLLPPLCGSCGRPVQGRQSQRLKQPRLAMTCSNPCHLRLKWRKGKQNERRR